MLKILLGKENWPNNLDRNVDRLFGRLCNLPNDSVTKYVLLKIENATYCDTISFIDRFGYKLPINCLSTGTKALLLAIQTGEPVCFDECAGNVFGVAIMLSSFCDMTICYSVLMRENNIVIDQYVGISVVVNNNQVITNIEDIYDGGLIYGV